MSIWLDTQTKAILQGCPPEKLAPPDIAEFSLVLIETGEHPDRLQMAVDRLSPTLHGKVKLSPEACPQVLATGLMVQDAMIGQFELICCDAISVFVRDEVALEGSRDYLRDLYSRLSSSAEFVKVEVSIKSVPETDRGKRFLHQFLGLESELAVFPIRKRFAWKKARIMAHWAEKTQAEVSCGSP